jgi:hypothetical protein
MPSLQPSTAVRTKWLVQVQLPGMLRPIDDDDLPKPALSEEATECRMAFSGITAARDPDGFRIPSLGETPLSPSERQHAMKRGLI